MNHLAVTFEIANRSSGPRRLKLDHHHTTDFDVKNAVLTNTSWYLFFRCETGIGNQYGKLVDLLKILIVSRVYHY